MNNIQPNISIEISIAISYLYFLNFFYRVLIETLVYNSQIDYESQIEFYVIFDIADTFICMF